ncbi:unnamed protein product [Owenia fusiformis]|uniref:UPAR/Ly6 domain-containing protein n=1 Tax=Owenia fusiformis TaxID=6347 RepID=A0A8S4NPY5_OWEFU|nr:unnamed protein product [Owenia fusiformis]
MTMVVNVFCQLLVASIVVLQLGFSTAQLQNALVPRLCWECDEDIQTLTPNCPSPFDITDSTFTLNYTICPSGQYYCKKTISDAFSGAKVSRSCAETCKESEVLFGIGETVSCCTSDKCNGTVRYTEEWIVLVLSLGFIAWIHCLKDSL